MLISQAPDQGGYGMQAVAFPLETVARRLQVNGGSNFAALTARIVQEGGPAALYRCSTMAMYTRRYAISLVQSCPAQTASRQQPHVETMILTANAGVAHGLQGHRRSQPEGGAHGMRQLWDV